LRLGRSQRRFMFGVKMVSKWKLTASNLR
jgi:hypothetical protein